MVLTAKDFLFVVVWVDALETSTYKEFIFKKGYSVGEIEFLRLHS